MRSALACAVALVCCACFQLGDNTLYHCNPNGQCTRPDYSCRSDGLCHPRTEPFGTGGGMGGAGVGGSGSAGGGTGQGDGGPGTMLPDGGQHCAGFDDCPPLLTCGGAGVDGECAADTTFCNADGWCWDLPWPQGNTLWHLARAGAEAWAVGNAGTILRFDGARWHRVRSHTTEDLFGVWAGASNDVWFVGNRDTLLHYDGSTLAAQPSPAAGTTWRAVWGRGASEVWIGGSSCKLYRLESGAWVDHHDPKCGGEVRAISASGSGIVAAGGDDAMSKRWVGTFNGATWTEELFGNTSGRAAWDVLVTSGGSLLVAAGKDGLIDNDVSLGGDAVYALAESAAGVFAFGERGSIQQRGLFWSTLQPKSQSNNTFYAATAGDNGSVLLAGERGELGSLPAVGPVHHDWRGPVSTFSFAGVFALDPSHVYASYGNGGFAVRGSSGWSWNDSAYQYEPGPLWAGSPRAIWATAPSNAGVQVTDGGSNSSEYVTDFPEAIWGFDEQNILLGGNWLQLLHGNTGSLSVLTSGFSPITGLCGAGDLAWAVSYNAGTLRITRAGDYDLNNAMQAPLNACNALDPWHVYAVGDQGVTQVFTDAGWQSQMQQPVTSLLGVFARSPTEVYAVGVDGGIFKGNGLSYQQVQSSTRNDLLAIHGLLDGGIWVVGEGNIILRHR